MKNKKKVLTLVAVVLAVVSIVVLFTNVFGYRGATELSAMSYKIFADYSFAESSFNSVKHGDAFQSIWLVVNSVCAVGAAVFAVCYITCAVLELLSKKVGKEVRLVKKVSSLGLFVFALVGLVAGVVAMIVNSHTIELTKTTYKIVGEVGFYLQIASLLGGLVAIASNGGKATKRK